MKVLVVEDEIKVANFIKEGLEEYDFEVVLAHDGYAGEAASNNNHYDIILLDVMIPKLDGIELCKLIREKNKTVPILMLTALGSIEHKLAGFDAGADDYLVKPFDFEELLARIKSLVKRTKDLTGNENILKVSDLELNLENKTVKRSGKMIELTAKEFSLLEYLVVNKNKVVKKSDIAEKVWDINFDSGTNVIEVYINFLRKKIDKDFKPKLIYTLVGMGYMLKEI